MLSALHCLLYSSTLQLALFVLTQLYLVVLREGYECDLFIPTLRGRGRGTRTSAEYNY